MGEKAPEISSLSFEEALKELENVCVLDGGFTAWKEEKLPVTDKPTEPLEDGKIPDLVRCTAVQKFQEFFTQNRRRFESSGRPYTGQGHQFLRIRRQRFREPLCNGWFRTLLPLLLLALFILHCLT